MKNAFLAAVAVVAGLSGWPEAGFAQGAVRTDTAGNPVTSFNLGGSNVAGTLAAERLPSAARPPIVQTITQTYGSVTLGPGTNVAVLGAVLIDTLSLTLPASGSYPVGRVLVVVDPGGYSHEDTPVQVVPAAGNTLNGTTGPLTALTDRGSVGFFPSGDNRWTVGQSCLLAASTRGVVVRSPATTPDGVSLSVRNGNGSEMLSVRGDGTTCGVSLALANALSCDDTAIGTDGEGTLSAYRMTAPNFCLSNAIAPADLDAPTGQAVLYFGADGLVHCRTPNGTDHVLSWTTTPTH